MSADNSLAVVLWVPLWNPKTSNGSTSAAAATVLVGAPGPTNEAVADDSMPALIACTEADDDTTPDSISEEGWLKKTILGIEKLSVDACFRLPQSALVSASTQERVASPAADLQRGERCGVTAVAIKPRAASHFLKRRICVVRPGSVNMWSRFSLARASGYTVSPVSGLASINGRKTLNKCNLPPRMQAEAINRTAQTEFRAPPKNANGTSRESGTSGRSGLFKRKQKMVTAMSRINAKKCQ
ncbi:hypothetical protein C8F04DRAFT_1187129 [Mycena alexandri]|uniref:Uncharacterized protein n=1 Tax=Mycena alexandri TaxID=1745969 RepID=A0AAD6SLW6_9AGAR|nr:hypothetical protein C8F04DRAFT_1187129 [Mycena alexandri]